MHIHDRGNNAAWTPFPDPKVRCKLSIQGMESLLSIFSNSCTNLTNVYPASVNANCCPTQILGPPLKGKYPHPTRRVSQRSGLNSSASSPYRSFRRCMEYTPYAMSVPFATKIGALPSTPPPTGRVVSLLAKRMFWGTEG